MAAVDKWLLTQVWLYPNASLCFYLESSLFVSWQEKPAECSPLNKSVSGISVGLDSSKANLKKKNFLSR